MKFSDNYYKQREINCLNKIDEVCKDMPSILIVKIFWKVRQNMLNLR